jgi:hypothetical protein
MTTPDPLRLYTVAELAALWGTGEDWLRKGAAARRLPHHRVAREIRFTEADAAEILAGLAVRPAHTPTRDEVGARRADVARTDRRAA